MPACCYPGCPQQTEHVSGLCTWHFVTDSFDERPRHPGRIRIFENCGSCGRQFEPDPSGATSCPECASWPPQTPRCPSQASGHSCVRPQGHEGPHQSDSALWPIPEDFVLRNGGASMQYEATERVRLRPVEGPIQVQLPAGGMPPGTTLSIRGRPGQRVHVEGSGIQIGDRIQINGVDAGVVTQINETYEGGRHSRTGEMVPISTERTARPVPGRREAFPMMVDLDSTIADFGTNLHRQIEEMLRNRQDGDVSGLDAFIERMTERVRLPPDVFSGGSTNPCGEIPLGNHEMPRVMQPVTWCEQEIAILKQALGDVDLSPGSMARLLMDMAASQGVDVHELTKAMVAGDPRKSEFIAKILGEEYERNKRRSRFERDDVI